MNKNLEILFCKIIEDESLFNDFMEKETLEDLYKFAIKIQDGYTEKEFEDFMIKMINFVENKRFKLLDDESNLSEVSGGISMKNKTIPAALMSLMAASFMPANAFASNADSNYSSASIYKKNDDNNDDNFVNKAKKAVAKFYSENKKPIIGGGTAAILILGLGAKSFWNHHHHSYDYDTFINKYLRTSPNLSFDDWFSRLGGTDAYIDYYCRKWIQGFDGFQQESNEAFRTIDVDYPRTEFYFKSANDINEKKELLRKFLKIYAVDSREGYVQGWDRFAILVIEKFSKCNRSVAWNEEDEAKMYYIYQTIVKTSMGNIVHKADEFFDQVRRMTSTTLKSYLSKYSSDVNKLLLERDGLRLLTVDPYVTCGFDMFSREQAINLWDNIISDNHITNNGHFDAIKARDKIAIVINSVFAKIVTEHREVLYDLQQAQKMMKEWYKSSDSRESIEGITNGEEK